MREAASKNYVENKFENVIDFNDVKLENDKFVKVNCQPAVNEHMTPKIYVDNKKEEIKLVKKIKKTISTIIT